ncbi:MAG: arginine--tRNA ligase [Verrucomicrobiales bacterium]|nr:arginine--tRNA ligase [Verrucomicrobiales bacterium]
MPSSLPHSILEQRLRRAVGEVLPSANLDTVQVRPCPDPKHGDYQCTALIGLAKQARLNPRAFAQEVLAAYQRLQQSGGDASIEVGMVPEIAGPGFLNFRIDVRTSLLPAALAGADRLFCEPARPPRTVVVDFSSPNVAKPMHVGHIRSTTLGDCLQRAFRSLGHRVITDNHIGDWGTQFGKLLVGWRHGLDRAALEQDPIAELERLYRTENAAGEADPSRLEMARQELVKLQSGDPENLAVWKEMIRLSQVQFDAIYGRLGVTFDHTLGESFYNPQLPEVVADLMARGIARESEGAVAVFSDGSLPPKEDPFLVNRDGEWVPDPALIRKSDGGFNYMTTDLATLDHRIRTWAPDEIIYVVDDRQAPHFRKLFLTFARWKPEAAARTRLRHIGFGKILGDDGRPFRTRSGDTIRLAELLDEAVERSQRLVDEKRPELPDATRRQIAETVGVGAVKYQDLLPNRQSDYVFSWDKMLALTGNTSPYLQYQCTRAGKVVREGGPVDRTRLASAVPTEEAEIVLLKYLLNYGLTLESVVAECRPNYLCNYLYELAGHYSRFYEACPVLRAGEPVRTLRLALCDLTARVLQDGLRILGIGAPEVM